MHFRPGDLKSRQAALAGSEEIPFAAQPQVLLGDAKPVFGLAQNGEPRLCCLTERRLVQQQAG